MIALFESIVVVVLTTLASIIIIVVATESFRYLQISLLSRHFKNTIHVSYVFLEWTCMSTPSSLLRFFSSKNEEIFSSRVELSNKARNKLYVIYRWDYIIRLRNISCVINDITIATKILKDSSNWIKGQNTLPIRNISGLSCTSANGVDSTRQRQILISSMKNRKQFDWAVIAAADKLVDKLTSSASIDLIPLLFEASLEVMMCMIFGEPTTAVVNFKAKYVPFWNLVRTNTGHYTATQKEERNRKMQHDIDTLKHLLRDIVFEKKVVLLEQQNKKREETCSNNPCILDKLIALTDFTLTDNTNFFLTSLVKEEVSVSVEDGMITIVVVEEGGGIGNDFIKRKDDIEKFSLMELVSNLHNLITASYEAIAQTLASSIYFLIQIPTSTSSSSTSSYFYTSLLSDDSENGHGENASLLGSLRLKAHIKESLRLRPPVLQMLRKNVNACTLRNGGGGGGDDGCEGGGGEGDTTPYPDSLSPELRIARLHPGSSPDAMLRL